MSFFLNVKSWSSEPVEYESTYEKGKSGSFALIVSKSSLLIGTWPLYLKGSTKELNVPL